MDPSQLTFISVNKNPPFAHCSRNQAHDFTPVINTCHCQDGRLQKWKLHFACPTAVHQLCLPFPPRVSPHFVVPPSHFSHGRALFLTLALQNECLGREEFGIRHGLGFIGVHGRKLYLPLYLPLYLSAAAIPELWRGALLPLDLSSRGPLRCA